MHLGSQKSTRASAVESGTLERLCGFWRAHQTVGDLEGHVFNFDIVELMVCILGLGDIPRALDQFLHHDGYRLIVSAPLPPLFQTMTTLDQGSGLTLDHFLQHGKAPTPSLPPPPPPTHPPTHTHTHAHTEYC